MWTIRSLTSYLREETFLSRLARSWLKESPPRVVSDGRG
jgi:hypothetical protein